MWKPEYLPEKKNLEDIGGTGWKSTPALFSSLQTLNFHDHGTLNHQEANNSTKRCSLCSARAALSHCSKRLSSKHQYLVLEVMILL